MRIRQLWKNLLLLILILSLSVVPLETMAGAGDVGPEETTATMPADRGRPASGQAVSSSGILAMNWPVIETVDSSGNVGQYTSIALDSAGRPHISYFDATNGDLKYAYYDGSIWIRSTVDSTGLQGYYTSLALDSAGLPHISYWDYTNYDLKYAHYLGASVGNCGPSNTWQCDTVDSFGTVGGFTSLAVDASFRVHISYYDYTNGDLKYAYQSGPGGNCGPGNTWRCTAVDSSGNVGQWTSLKLDTAGRPHISYYDVANGDLKYAYFDGAVWHIETVDSALDVGTYTSLALDTSAQPHISYLELSYGHLKYARYVGAGGNCGGPSYTWQCDELCDVEPTGGHTSLALDSLDRPHISYYYYPTSDLQYAYYVGGGGNCGPSASWRCETVDSAGSVGQYTSLAVDANFRVHISYYYMFLGDLKHASGCLPVEQATIGGPDFLTIGESGTYTATYLLPNATMPVTLTWDDGTVGPTAAYSWTMPGVYAIAVTATNACLGGIGRGTFTVTVCQPVQAVEPHGPDFLLTGEPGIYTATHFPPDTTLPVTLTWSNGTVGPAAAYSWPEPGLYTIVVTATNRCEEDGVRGTFIVAVCQPVETVNVSGPDFRQVGEPGTYNASYLPPDANQPVTFTWDNGTVGPTAVYNWTEPGLYTITVTATNPCGVETPGTFAVTVCQPVEDVVVSGPDFLLTGEPGTYAATYSPPDTTQLVTLTWSNGTVGPTADYSWPEPGVYTIVVTATNPCEEEGVRGTFAVTVCQPAESATIEGPDMLFVDELGTYTATYSPPDTTPPVTFTWDNGTVGPTATYSWPELGLYTITVTATSRCGDEVSASFIVSVTLCKPVESVVISGPDVLLVNETGTYTATYYPLNPSVPVTLTWSNGTTGTSAVYGWPSPGLYTITVTATNPCEHVVSATLAVSVTLCKPVASVTIDGPEVLLVDETGIYTATYYPLNPTPPVTFTWDNGTVGPTADYSWPAPGVYTITVTATNPCGKVITGTYAVSVTLCKPVSSVAVSGPDVLPVGKTGAYTATYSPPNATLPVTLTWDNGTVGPTAVYSWAETGLHTITVTATGRCGPEVSRTVAVDVCQAVSAVTITGPLTLQARQTGTYTATYLPSDATEPVTLSWSNGTVGPSAVYSWTVAGTHALTATASSICGDVRGSAWVTVFGKVYLPLVVKHWNRCFINQMGFWEYEPNDTWTEANGPLCSGPEYYGHADDTYDLFSILSGAGLVDVLVRHYTADGGQLVLYDENHNIIVRDPFADPDLHVTAAVASGEYFIMLYGTGGYTTTQWYTLTAIFPQP